MLFSSTNNAYATEPVVTSFTLQNLDNSIPAISNGDTLSITFSRDTDRGGFPLNVPIGVVNVDLLFDSAHDRGNDYDGKWVNNRTFVITFIDAVGSELVLGTSFLVPGATPIRDASAPADIWVTSSPILRLPSSSGDGCNTECQSPTLGLDKNGRRLV